MSIAEKLTAVAENVPKVYEAGKKAQYDEFWDSFIGIKDYNNMFAGEMWNDTTFKPKYNIIVGALNINTMFYNNACTNIKKAFEDKGLIFDISKAVSTSNLFTYASTEELPIIDVSSSGNIAGIFSNMSRLTTIDGFKFKNGVSFANVFNSTSKLENITIIDSVISVNNFDIHWSTKLSAASLYSIINALSTTTSGLTITLPTTAEANYNANPPVGAPQTWAALVATKQNYWTFAYA
jgi:hypothetical protein